MQFVIIGLVLLLGAGTLVVAARRSGPRLGWIALPAAAALGLFGLAALVLIGWAYTATDSSQLARALVWGDSAVGDQDRFPSRTFEAATTPVVFTSNGGFDLANYRGAGYDLPLAELAAGSSTTAFIVIQGDSLLYEEYFNGSAREDVQTSFSVAKSFTATLIGIAEQEGFISSLEDPVTDYLPELAASDTRFGDITLRHLITMSSGLSFVEGASPWDDPANTYHGTDLRSAVRSTPEITGPPGQVFHYNDWNVIMLGMVLERSTGLSVSEYTETRLWQPMGAEAAGSWSLDSDAGGFEKMFVGVNGRAIDFAKLGWLYLHDGRNGTSQVVPSKFVMDATSLDTSTDPAEEYQYLWWIDTEPNAYYAQGDHGQFIYVYPDAQLVIVRHGTTPADVDWVDYIGELAVWLEANGEPG